MTTARRGINGSSMAMASSRTKLGDRFRGSGGSEPGSSAPNGSKRQEERIAGQPDKRLRIQAGHQRDEYRDRQCQRLRHEFPGLELTLVADSRDRKSTRLNSSHYLISYAVFCLKKKKKNSTRNSSD